MRVHLRGIPSSHRLSLLPCQCMRFVQLLLKALHGLCMSITLLLHLLLQLLHLLQQPLMCSGCRIIIPSYCSRQLLLQLLHSCLSLLHTLLHLLQLRRCCVTFSCCCSKLLLQKLQLVLLLLQLHCLLPQLLLRL
jgi:hypothetical protein